MALRAVFFDLDGTLLDTAQDLSAALASIMQEDGLEPLALNIARNIVSEGSYALVKAGYELNDNDKRIEPLRQRLLEHYMAKLNQHTTPFAGIEQLIDSLQSRGLAWGIVTNKPWPLTEPLVKQFRFASEPSCVLAPEHVQQRKPHPESLYLACKQTGCEPFEAIYIGDHLRDIECGRNAGMKTIAVNYGYIPADEDSRQWQADHYVDSADEIWPIVQRYL
ncbi:HAD family hydrolase [Agaribacterium haliotis]|uniref:HAD family hydrolase n=1 Tax=Agaribacterium haliotis TaxID=2013869 RepID=UPI000BB588FD|nr:HAD-IA family hydrolase [Agaribacterium haliotis]